jgi:DNA-binding transcriptional MocR family regulator
MFSLLFRNRWFAIGYVALTLVSASLFVSQDGGADKLAQTTKQLQAQRAQFAQQALPSAPPPAAPSPPEQGPNVIANTAAPTAAAISDAALLRPLPGSNADPARPKAGDEFINSVTGQRVRAIRLEDAEGYQRALSERQGAPVTP